jgi:hypothetical protein
MMVAEFSNGTLGVPALSQIPAIPSIVSEWSALLPLVCHLATPREDYVTTGEVSLLGRIHVPLLPKLGALLGIARLLRKGARYLDYASTGAETSQMVWDVKWGSVFPAANGAAVSWVCDYLRHCSDRTVLDVPEEASMTMPPQPNTHIPVTSADTPGYRRHQILHVYDFEFTTKPTSQTSPFRGPRAQAMYNILWLVLLLLIIAGLGLVGTYGTAAALLCTAISQVVARRTAITRPSTYLKNTELHDAAMLLAAHQNAVEWHLFIGNRSIVDNLLNKPMIEFPQGRRARLAARWFATAHILQLVAMTYVAAQRGWDGVALVLVLAGYSLYCLVARGENLARAWLKKEGIRATTLTFRFGGRTAMVGAIEQFKGAHMDVWMDSILAPHLRRDAWLRFLRGQCRIEELAGEFDDYDIRWIEGMARAALAGGEFLSHKFKKMSSTA